MAKKKPAPALAPVPIDEDALYVVTEVDADDLIASHHVCRGLSAARQLALKICDASFGPLAPRKRQAVRNALADHSQYLENRGNGGCSVNIDTLEAPRDHALALFTLQELATVLAALRHWQATPLRCLSQALRTIATDHDAIVRLSPGEIDALCRRLNYGA